MPNQAAMLETIIQDQDFTFEFFHGGRSQCGAIRPLEVWDIGEIFFQHHRFIIATIFRPIAAAQDRHLHSAFSEETGYIFHAGSFSGSAQRQIANADHGSGCRG